VRWLALLVALLIASCVRAVVLDPDSSAPDPDGGAVPDAQSIDDGGPPSDGAVPDVPQD
jgi:hypothetical protein